MGDVINYRRWAGGCTTVWVSNALRPGKHGNVCAVCQPSATAHTFECMLHTASDAALHTGLAPAPSAWLGPVAAEAPAALPLLPLLHTLLPLLLSVDPVLLPRLLGAQFAAARLHQTHVRRCPPALPCRPGAGAPCRELVPGAASSSPLVAGCRAHSQPFAAGRGLVPMTPAEDQRVFRGPL
jgi:hypothetical protein